MAKMAIIQKWLNLEQKCFFDSPLKIPGLGGVIEKIDSKANHF